MAPCELWPRGYLKAAELAPGFIAAARKPCNIEISSLGQRSLIVCVTMYGHLAAPCALTQLVIFVMKEMTGGLQAQTPTLETGL